MKVVAGQPLSLLKTLKLTTEDLPDSRETEVGVIERLGSRGLQRPASLWFRKQKEAKAAIATDLNENMYPPVYPHCTSQLEQEQGHGEAVSFGSGAQNLLGL